MNKKEWVALSLGGNIGDRKHYIKAAILELERSFKSELITSNLYETEAWGFESENAFLNCCVFFKSDLNSRDILKITQEIERKLGRKKVKKCKNNTYESRVIDIDILYVGENIVKEDNLIIPHPELYSRSFVLTPFSEVFPEFVDPVKKVKIKELLAVCNDKNAVILYKD